MPQNVQEFADITALIRGILNGYPGNSAILREYIQNSDDAGATSQIFILDERQYPNTSLVDESLRFSQGPALIAINDGLLSEADWISLNKIHSSSKLSEESQTGRNGLGFRASYHLTENPHILSGSTLRILDPHHFFVRKFAGGVDIDIVRDRASYEDQFTPFTAVIGNLVTYYQGTAFRLPLRTIEQANISKIKDTPTLASDLLDELGNFAKNELEQVILFLKHITKIEVRHISPAGDMTILGAATIDALPNPTPSSIVRSVDVTSSNGDISARKWLFHHSSQEKAHAASLMSRRLGYDVGKSLAADKLTPTINLALPLARPPNFVGRLYSLLPFPQKTWFPVHVNAVFALAPDRQSLKNAMESGLPNSRERRLVEWNRMIFDTLLPRIWARFLKEIPSSLLLNIGWHAWPPAEDDRDCYWSGLPSALVDQVLTDNLSVFLTVPGTYKGESTLVSLQDSSVILAPLNPTISLVLLSALGLKIIQPPSHIFELLSSSKISAPVLTPASLHRILFENYLKSDSFPVPESTTPLIEYLVFSTSSTMFDYMVGIPWLNRPNNSSNVCLEKKTARSVSYIVPATELESQIFSTLPTILSWPVIYDRLRKELSLPKTSLSFNVSSMTVLDVINYLSHRFDYDSSNKDEITEASRNDHAWLIQFWTWMQNWSLRADFFGRLNAIAYLFLLPTAYGGLRKLSARIISFEDSGEHFADAWNLLGVNPLHCGVPNDIKLELRNKLFIEIPRSNGYIPLLIRSCDPTKQKKFPDLSYFDAIRQSLVEGLPRFQQVSLSVHEQDSFALLRIFKVRGQPGQASSLKKASRNLLLVNTDILFPLPVIKDHPNSIFIDATDSTTLSLVQLINPLPLNGKVLTEVDLLCFAVDNWPNQTQEAQDAFIESIFLTYLHNPKCPRSKLADLPFVAVEGISARVPPRNLIHPSSFLASLYKGEAGKLPINRFRKGDFLSVMVQLGFVRSELHQEIVKDRLKYFSENSPDSDPYCFEKAEYFLTCLNQYWSPLYAPLVVEYRGLSWIPSPNGMMLESPASCRDAYPEANTHQYCYDLVLRSWKTVKVPVLDFRKALGWSEVLPFDILHEQLSRTLNRQSSDQYERLIKLINYLGNLYIADLFSPQNISELQDLLKDKNWIPVASVPSRSSYSVGDKIILNDKYVLLSPDSNLKPPFHHIDHHLHRIQDFLLKMGCTLRPSFSILISELDGIRPTDIANLEAAISILDEIVSHHPSFDSQLLRIPTEGLSMLPLENIYFRDMTVSAPPDFAPAHKLISRDLADRLGMQHLSSLNLEDDDDDIDDSDDDKEQMSVDLEARIRGFLRDYDKKYSFNEFIANADDSGATEFSILFNSRKFPHERVLSPEFQKLGPYDSLVIHCNSLFSDDDFKGIRRVGTGGKSEKQETHGRHGLGALSLYYFTDVVTVISGKSVMFLDPSGKYLPRRRRNKRTSLRKSITSIARKYPDQLRPLEDLFDFSSSSPSYKGTLFFLPLNTTIYKPHQLEQSALHMLRTSFFELANRAFFFTNLETISAKITGFREDFWWSFLAERSDSDAYSRLVIRSNKGVDGKIHFTDAESKHWIITTSNSVRIPDEHKTIAADLKIKSNMTVQLAICPSEIGKEDFKAYLFSTVSLPHTTSLPFHLNAPFAISSNRQGIVLNPVDSQNRQDSKTAFNNWILECLVPDLYLSSLNVMRHENVNLNHKRWWFADPSPDMASRLTKQGLYKILPQNDKKILLDINGQLIRFQDAIFPSSYKSSVETAPLEDRAIERILDVTKPSGYTPSCLYAGMAMEIPSARKVDPAFVKASLWANLQAFDHAFQTKEIEKRYVFRVFSYLCESPPLVGLPLLCVMSSERLVPIPGRNDPPIYYSNDDSHAALFSSANFIDLGYDTKVLQYLENDQDANFVELTENVVLELTKNELERLNGEPNSERQISEWVEYFWEIFETFPGPPTASSLEESGLKLFRCNNLYINLAECQPDRNVYYTSARDRLYDILLQLGIELLTCDIKVPRSVTKLLESRFPDKLANVLKCIANSPHVSSLLNLNDSDLTFLADWIQDRVSGRISDWARYGPPISRELLLQLPIWYGYSSRSVVAELQNASRLKILPYTQSIQHFLGYLRHDIWITPYSATLIQFMTFCNGTSSTMTAVDIMNAVTLPGAVHGTEQIRVFKDFITAMLTFPRNVLLICQLRVPDGTGILRDIGNFYDGVVGLFTTTLSDNQSLFIHPDFQDLVPSLRNLGLRHEITLDTFITCARAVQRAMENQINRGRMEEMSDAAFEAYQTNLPPLLMLNAHSWSRVDEIKFIRRKNIRRQGASYDVEPYCNDLPLLLAPDLLVSENLEPIAWTQRGLFITQPAETVKTVNKTLGIPSAHEVVAHLIILATKIAKRYPLNFNLLPDLKATYKWLNENHSIAKESLASAFHHKLFLNVVDPSINSWTNHWVTAREIILDLDYDVPAGKSVKSFLQAYRDLLVTAGCKTFVKPRRTDATLEGANAMEIELRKSFNKMRNAGTLLDGTFVLRQDGNNGFKTTNTEDDGASSSHSDTIGALSSSIPLDEVKSAVFDGQPESVDVEVPMFHLAFLAAAVPHHQCNYSFQQEERGSTLMWKSKEDLKPGLTLARIEFPGSAFGAKLFLDFIYTGEFDVSEEILTPENKTMLLRHMIGLLDVAEQWDMMELKRKLENDIIDMMALFLDHELLQEVHSAAVTYRADNLLKAINDFRIDNEEVLG